jgi:hypothetical protein
LTTPAQVFKQTGTGEYGARISRRDCLHKLAAVSKFSGSKKIPVFFAEDQGEYKEENEEVGQSIPKSFDEIWLDVMKSLLEDFGDSTSETNTEQFWRAYHSLGTQSMICWCPY